MNADDRIVIDTRIDTDSAQRDLDKLKGKLKDTSTEARTGFTQASTATEKMDGAIKSTTLSLSAMQKALASVSIIGAIKMIAGGFSSIMTTTEEAYASIRKASTLFGNVAVDQERLVQNLSSIASSTGSDISTLGEAVYQAMSAGIAPTEDMADVLDVVSKSAQLAKGGFTDTETALSASLSVLNAYKLGVEDLERVQGILLQAQNQGVTTVGQLGSALSKVTPTASAFGVSFEDVATSLALMTKQGTNTEVASTALSAVLSELGKNGTTASKNLEKASKSAGLSATSFKELLADGYNLSEILTIMSTYAEENELSMVDMFSSIEAGRASLQLSGKNLESYNSILSTMGDTAGLVGDAFQKIVTPSERLESAWDALVLKIGEETKPTFEGLQGVLATVLEEITGQNTSGETLERTLSNITIASNALKEAQKGAGDEITKTSLAMDFQTQVGFWTSIAQASKNYSDLSKQLQNYKKEEKELSRVYENQRKILEEAGENAQKNGKAYKMPLEEVISILAQFKSGANINIGDIFSTDSYQDLMNIVDYIGDTETELARVQNSIDATQKQMDDFVASLANMVQGQLITISDIAIMDEGLASSVGLLIRENNRASRSLVEVEEGTLRVKDGVENVKKSIEDGPKDDGVAKKIYGWKELLEDVEKDLENATKSAMQGFGRAIGKAFEELLQKGEKIKELEDELAELDERKVADTEAVEEAEAKLAEAQAKGNASAIKSAETMLESRRRTLKGTQDLIDATKAEKKSVEDGSTGWKTLGRSAMETLASVLDGLGAELAAHAVTAAFLFNWGGAAAATAGSVAAFAAAALLRAQKFAQGGIVGGNSYSGDNVLARVNSGELILTVAQQENLANALSLLGNNGGVGGISLNFSGASFYGLDEPAVGKAIYENIRQLQYEGVI